MPWDGKNGAPDEHRLRGDWLLQPPASSSQNPDINVEKAWSPGEPKYESLGLEYAPPLTALCGGKAVFLGQAVVLQATVDALAWKGVRHGDHGEDLTPRYAHGREVHTWDGKKMTVEEDDKFDQPTMV